MNYTVVELSEIMLSVSIRMWHNYAHSASQNGRVKYRLDKSSQDLLDLYKKTKEEVDNYLKKNIHPSVVDNFDMAENLMKEIISKTYKP